MHGYYLVLPDMWLAKGYKRELGACLDRGRKSATLPDAPGEAYAEAPIDGRLMGYDGVRIGKNSSDGILFERFRVPRARFFFTSP